MIRHRCLFRSPNDTMSSVKLSFQILVDLLWMYNWRSHSHIPCIDKTLTVRAVGLSKKIMKDHLQNVFSSRKINRAYLHSLQNLLSSLWEYMFHIHLPTYNMKLSSKTKGQFGWPCRTAQPGDRKEEEASTTLCNHKGVSHSSRPERISQA